ncbi:unnamed protein product [Amoebophrya sp. A120]|nr:unnamed protein product [Amoebophrya sp. A120]|eukprot:GSA120T00018564001.1
MGNSSRSVTRLLICISIARVAVRDRLGNVGSGGETPHTTGEEEPADQDPLMFTEVGAHATYTFVELWPTSTPVGMKELPRQPGRFTRQPGRISEHRGLIKWCQNKGFFCFPKVWEAHLMVGDFLACKCSPSPWEEKAAPGKTSAMFNFTSFYVPWNSPAAIIKRREKDQRRHEEHLPTEANSGPSSWFDRILTTFSPLSTSVEEKKLVQHLGESALLDRSLRGSADFAFGDAPLLPGAGVEPLDAAHDLKAVRVDGGRTGQRGRWESVSNADPFLIHFTAEIERRIPPQYEEKLGCDHANGVGLAYLQHPQQVCDSDGFCYCHELQPWLPIDVDRFVLRMPVLLDNWCWGTCFDFVYDKINADVDKQEVAGSAPTAQGLFAKFMRVYDAMRTSVVRYAEKVDDPCSVVKMDFVAEPRS